MQSKIWYKSRTMWFNILSLLVTFAGLVLQYLDQLGLTDAQAAIVAIILNMFVNVANMYLRKITNTAIQ